MKTLFASRIGQEPEFYDNLLENATIAFDANVLLNLYRYSEETREQIFDVLEQLNSRIILPYQAAVEYFNNRINVIEEQCKTYEKTQKGLSEIKKALENKRTNPFITRMLSNEFNDVIDKVLGELASNNKSYDEFISNDEIMKKISNLFDKKIISEFNEEKLNEAINEGAIRYKHKTPPGYADVKAKSKEITEDSPLQERVRPFGDFIIWLQLIEYSKLHSVDIIFVTDDTKQDWFDDARGKTISPRHELVREFNKLTGKHFYSYPVDSFLKHINTFVETTINEDTVNEVTELSKSFSSPLKKEINSEKIKNLENSKINIYSDIFNGHNFKNNHEDLYHLEVAEQLFEYNEILLQFRSQENKLIKKINNGKIPFSVYQLEMENIRTNIFEIENRIQKLKIELGQNGNYPELPLEFN